MQLDQIEAFVTIARAGNLTRAAASLHLSQPAVSRRLTLLEHQLGAPIFERVRSGVVLTAAGHAFMPFAESVLAGIRDGRDAVRALERPDEGEITLALVGTLASTALPRRLAAFRRAHPRVRLLLRTDSSRAVSEMVRRGDASLGLRYFPDRSAEIESHTISDEALVVACAAHHRLARARSVAPRALAGEAWIGFPVRPGGEGYAHIQTERLAACGLGGAELIAIDSRTAQKRLIEAGFGLGLLPETSIEEELRRRTLAVLRVPAMRASIPVVAIHRRRSYLGGAARRLLEMLRSSKMR